MANDSDRDSGDNSGHQQPAVIERFSPKMAAPSIVLEELLLVLATTESLLPAGLGFALVQLMLRVQESTEFTLLLAATLTHMVLMLVKEQAIVQVILLSLQARI